VALRVAHPMPPVESPPVTEPLDLAPPDPPSALRALELLSEHLQPAAAPGVVFLDVYAAVTRRVAELLADPGHGFCEPDWAAELTALFAEKALIAVYDAHCGQPIASKAWQLATAAHRSVRPYQYALLGINAHINHDLARVMVHYLSLRPDLFDNYRRDYFHVMTILSAVAGECVNILAERYRCPFTRAILALPHGRGRMTQSILGLVTNWRQITWNYIIQLHSTDEDQQANVFVHMDLRSTAIAERLIAR
jgi:hypothetical protein